MIRELSEAMYSKFFLGGKQRSLGVISASSVLEEMKELVVIRG